MRRSDLLFRGLTIGNSLLMLAVFVGFRGGWLQFAESTPRVERSVPPLLSIANDDLPHATAASRPQREVNSSSAHESLSGDIPKPPPLMPGAKSATGILLSSKTDEMISNVDINRFRTPQVLLTTPQTNVGVQDNGGNGLFFSSLAPMLWTTADSFNTADLTNDPVISPEVISSKSLGGIVPQDAVLRVLDSSSFPNRPVRVHFNSAVVTP